MQQSAESERIPEDEGSRPSECSGSSKNTFAGPREIRTYCSCKSETFQSILLAESARGRISSGDDRNALVLGYFRLKRTAEQAELRSGATLASSAGAQAPFTPPFTNRPTHRQTTSVEIFFCPSRPQNRAGGCDWRV